jgi:hypothetical protein
MSEKSGSVALMCVQREKRHLEIRNVEDSVEFDCMTGKIEANKP